MEKHILFIVTSQDRLGSSERETGIYLPELSHACEIFLAANHVIAVASPKGQAAPVDPKSVTEDCVTYTQYAQDTIAFPDVDPDQYDAFLILGGHGSVWDLPGHPELQRILSHAIEQQKIIAAVSHGTSAFIGLQKRNGTPFIQGKQMTGLTNAEEAAIGLPDGVPFLLEDEFKKAGVLYSCAPNWQPHVVSDAQIITGQNPASVRLLCEAVEKMLLASPVFVQ